MLRAIIFDFGGVLYNIDYFATTRKLAELSSRPDLLINMDLESILTLPDNFERGIISSTEFRKYLRDLYFINGDDTKIDDCWNAMLLGLKSDSVNFVNTLKDKYKVVLLSNTNEIHYNYFYNETQGLIDIFDRTFFSHLIGLRKPDIEVYKYVCSEINCLPEETLFIDDSLLNIKGAQAAGLNTFHFTNQSVLSDLLHTI